MGIPERLKEARNQAGLSQQALADAIGTTKRSVINWEGGVGSPSAEVLERYAQSIGADVGYVITGLRDYEAPPALSAEEQMLLEYFREAPAAVRRAAIGALLGAATPSGQVMQNLKGGSHTMIGSIGGTYKAATEPRKKAKPKGE